jgi:N-methylhydantoinase B
MASFELTKLDRVFGSFFRDDTSGIIADAQGAPIFVKANYLSDYGTLPVAAEITQKYVKLKPGQVAILNDPYSGGSILSAMTFITCIEIQSKKGNSELILGLRFPLRPHLRMTASIEEEGLRIPPTLIGDKNGIFEDILSAITNHPLCPDDFGKYINDWFLKVKSKSELLGSLFKNYGIGFSKSLTQGYILNSKSVAESLVAQLPLGDSLIKDKLDGEEIIQLKIENDGKILKFDFRGTSDSKRYTITDGATLGCCIAAFQALVDRQFPINKGSLECFQVQTPTKSLLSGRYPSPTFLGMTEGTRIVAEYSALGLSKLGSKREIAVSGISQCLIDIEFQNGSHFYDFVNGGVGAKEGYEGEMGINLWDRTKLNPSIEDLETRFPIQIQKITKRKGSGGKGKFPGGAGILKSYKILQSGTLKWSSEQTICRPSGSHNGLSGAEAEITIKPEGGKAEALPGYGTLPVNPGDVLVVRSAGGGGWGRDNAQN